MISAEIINLLKIFNPAAMFFCIFVIADTYKQNLCSVVFYSVRIMIVFYLIDSRLRRIRRGS